MRRRINIVPFTNKPAKPDLGLRTKLKAEWPAILRWAIDGCLDWQKNQLIRPASVVDATSEYFSTQDTFSQWLDEECDVEPGNDWKSATSAELFTSWAAYAKRAGEAAQSRKTFAAALGKKGIFVKRGTAGVRTYLGVRLKPDAAEEAARWAGQ
jgi:putative DNA primase/helicase